MRKKRNTHAVQFSALAAIHPPNMSHEAGSECKADGTGSYNAADLCTQQMASTGCKKIIRVLVDSGAQEEGFQR